MPLRVQMTETIRDRLTASTILDSEFYIPGNLQVPEQKSILAIDDVHKVARIGTCVVSSCCHPAWNFSKVEQRIHEDRKMSTVFYAIFEALAVQTVRRPCYSRHPSREFPLKKETPCMSSPLRHNITTTSIFHHEDCYRSICHPLRHCYGIRPYATNCWCVFFDGFVVEKKRVCCMKAVLTPIVLDPKSKFIEASMTTEY